MAVSDFSRYFPLAEGIVALLSPHAEAVVHDLARDRIVRIWNAFSKRKAGDRSLVAEDVPLAPGQRVYGPYPKTNFDGRALKCVSIVLDDAQGRAAGLLCVNLDVSQFAAMGQLLSAFAASAVDQPAMLTGADWREQINTALGAHWRAKNRAPIGLTRAERIEAIGMLDTLGLFATRNAAQHVADVLEVSRATVYALLKEARR